MAGDMVTVELTGGYHGIIAWDSIFHVPKAQHGTPFHRLSRWLVPGAPLLLSLGGSEGEFSAPMFGLDFFYTAPTVQRRASASYGTPALRSCWPRSMIPRRAGTWPCSVARRLPRLL